MALAVEQPWQPSPSVDAAELLDPIESARAAGLRYVSDLSPGLRRKRAGKGFTYSASNGSARMRISCAWNNCTRSRRSN